MSNEHGYHGNTENHLARLRRIEGQVRGLQRMISQGEYPCAGPAARESDEAAQAKVDEAAAAIARLIKS